MELHKNFLKDLIVFIFCIILTGYEYMLMNTAEIPVDEL
jgi:hypothetical protein